jgi:hypothetical protein
MVSRLIYSFLIDGNEALNYILKETKIQTSRNGDKEDSATLHVNKTYLDSYTIEAGMDVIIYRGVSVATETCRFRGKISRVETDPEKVVAICKGKIEELSTKEITKSFDKNIDVEAGELSAIAETIITGGGLTASVVASGTGSSSIVATKFPCKRSKRKERLMKIVKTLNYQYFYDYDNDYVRVEPKGYTSYSIPLIVGTNILNIPTWVHNLEPMRNKITIEGAYVLDTREDSFVGDNTTKDFTLSYVPEATEVTVDTILKARGIENSSISYDYTVDSNLKKVSFITAPGTSEAVVVKYTTKVMISPTGINNYSINKYGLTKEETFSFDDVITVEDAENRLNALLELLKDGAISTTIYTDEYTLKPGMSVSVTDLNNTNYSGSYVIFEIITNYPDPFDVIKLGTEEINIQRLFETIDERLKIIEGNTDFNDILRQTISINKEITVSRDSFELEQRKICDSFIANHPVNGLTSQGIILDAFESGNSANWSGDDLVVSDESTITKQGSGSMKLVYDSSIGYTTCALFSAQDYGDLSEYTGVSSGTPTQGTIGLWLYVADPDDVTELFFNIGSSSTDNITYLGRSYSSVNGYNNFGSLTLSLQAGWNYILFDLDNPEILNGTPDWTSVDFSAFGMTAQDTTVYLDYLTISKSNYIGLNGAGYRYMVV